MQKRYELVVTITLSLGEAPDGRTLRDAGLSDLDEYVESVIEGMDLGDLDDYELTFKGRRRLIETDEE